MNFYSNPTRRQTFFLHEEGRVPRVPDFFHGLASLPPRTSGQQKEVGLAKRVLPKVGRDEFQESLTFSAVGRPTHPARRDSKEKWDLQSASFRRLGSAPAPIVSRVTSLPEAGRIP